MDNINPMTKEGIGLSIRLWNGLQKTNVEEVTIFELEVIKFYNDFVKKFKKKYLELYQLINEALKTVYNKK